jgi:hypothetical protein
VLNHQHRDVPQERNPRPYRRPEFLAAQTEPVITTLALFEAWREKDAEAVRRLLFGDVDSPAGKSTLPTEGASPSVAVAAGYAGAEPYPRRSVLVASTCVPNQRPGPAARGRSQAARSVVDASTLQLAHVTTRTGPSSP